MLTDIQITLNPVLSVDVQARLQYIKDHAALQHLDYEHSGHTGFASSAFVKASAIKSLDSKSLFDTELIISEDSIFLNRLLLNNPKLGVVKDASYMYRKHSDLGSTIDKSTQNKDYYIHRTKNYFITLIEESKDNPILKATLGVHAEYSASESAINDATRLINKYKLPLFAHIAETELEVSNSFKKHGKSPLKFFDDQDLFKFGGGGYHCIYLDENDQETMKNKRLFLCACMGSNIWLHDGICPIPTYLEKGLKVALGTDGPASNESLSMWREMRLVKEYHPSIDDYKILEMGTLNGARMMGLTDCDYLDEGKKADLILVDAKDIHALVSTVKDEDVKLVFINGKQVFSRVK